MISFNAAFKGLIWCGGFDSNREFVPNNQMPFIISLKTDTITY